MHLLTDVTSFQVASIFVPIVITLSFLTFLAW
jgi:hypothetical protein